MKRDAFASGERNNDAGDHRSAPFGRAVLGRGVVEPLTRSKGYALRGFPNPGHKRPRQNARIWLESALEDLQKPFDVIEFEPWSLALACAPTQFLENMLGPPQPGFVGYLDRIVR